MLKTLLKTTALTAAALAAVSPVSAAVLVADTGWQEDVLLTAGGTTNKSAWTFTVDTSALFSLVDCCVGGDNYTLSGGINGATSYFAGLGSDVQASGLFAPYWTSADFSKLVIAVGPGTYTFSIRGDLGAGAGGAALGVRLDTVSGAVPEPMTWALMVVGLGAVGASMRRRVSTTVSFS